MAANVVNYLQRFSGFPIHQSVFSFCSYFVTKLIEHIASMDKVGGFFKFSSGCLFKVFTSLFLFLGEMVPCFKYFGVYTK